MIYMFDLHYRQSLKADIYDASNGVSTRKGFAPKHIIFDDYAILED